MRGLRQEAEGSQGAETVREAQALPLGFRMVRSEIRIRSLGRVHIGEAAYFVWALPPNVGGTAQRHPLWGILHNPPNWCIREETYARHRERHSVTV